MADGPQHSLQDMENATGFDLNRALDAWKEQLTSLPELSGDDVRELEGHLCECFENGRWRGLSEREAFEFAVRQIGPPESLRAEFAKLNPLRSWPHRVALMAFAGLLVWAWTSITDLFVAASPVVWKSITPLYAAFMSIFLNSVLPLFALAFVVKGQARSLFRGLAFLFSNRLMLLISVVIFGVLLNYTIAWSVWNYPYPEKIFGPGGREKLSIATLFWQYCLHLPSWPGPLLALLVWLAPCAQRVFSSASSQHASGRSLHRETVFWFSIGCVVLSCFAALVGSVVPLFSKLAFWLYPDAEIPFRILRSVLHWMPNVTLCAVALMAVHGKIRFVNELAANWFDARWKIAAGCILLICVCYGALGLSLSISQGTLLWLMSACFWPITFTIVLTWLSSTGKRPAY